MPATLAEGVVPPGGTSATPEARVPATSARPNATATPAEGDAPGEVPAKDQAPAEDHTPTACAEVQVTSPAEARVTTRDEATARKYLKPTGVGVPTNQAEAPTAPTEVEMPTTPAEGESPPTG